MMRPQRTPEFEPALERLASLAPLDAASVEAVDAAIAQAQTRPARRDIIVEGAPIAGARLIVEGWAARVRILADGRRQFLSFLLPGDLFGHCRQPAPLAVSTVAALTAVKVCPAPSSEALDRAYAISQAFEEAYLLEHVARLGRLSALERIYSLLLELHERLSRAGLATAGRFHVPLTQEMLADALGLTSVHINRMLQDARRSGMIEWCGASVALREPAAMAQTIGRAPVRVSAA